MRTYKCDRCGSTFADSGPTDPPTAPSASPEDLGLTNRMPIRHGSRVVVVEVDLCGPCVKALVQWMTYIEPKKQGEGVKGDFVHSRDCKNPICRFIWWLFGRK